MVNVMKYPYFFMNVNDRLWQTQSGVAESGPMVYTVPRNGAKVLILQSVSSSDEGQSTTNVDSVCTRV